MKIFPKDLSPRDAFRLLASVIVPRPIALVSTISPEGVPNAAPFCFFTGVTSIPPTLAISVMRRGEEMSKKDTIRNIELVRDFVVNVVDESLAQPMIMASGSYPPDMSEFDVAGLTSSPSELVRSPRVAESPISLECRVVAITELGQLPAALVIGEIVCVHVRDNVYSGGQIDFERLKPLARLGENTYSAITRIFEMNRPA